MECVPLPLLEAGPGARHTECRPDAAGPAVPQTKHGSGGPARTSHLTGHIEFTGTKHKAVVTGVGGAAHVRTELPGAMDQFRLPHRPHLPQSEPCTPRGELYRKRYPRKTDLGRFQKSFSLKPTGRCWRWRVAQIDHPAVGGPSAPRCCVIKAYRKCHTSTDTESSRPLQWGAEHHLAQMSSPLCLLMEKKF